MLLIQSIQNMWFIMRKSALQHKLFQNYTALLSHNNFTNIREAAQFETKLAIENELIREELASIEAVKGNLGRKLNTIA